MNIFLKDFCFGVLMIICTILLILLYNIDTYKSDELSEEQFGDLIFYEILGFVWVYNRFNYENTIPSENENADNAVKNFEKAGSNNNCFQNFNQKNAQSLAYSAYSETFNNKVEISILEISNILLSQIEPSKLDNYCIHDIFCSFKKFDSRHLNMGDYIEISNSFMNMIKANPKIYSINIKNQKIFIAPIDHQKLKSKISFFFETAKIVSFEAYIYNFNNGLANSECVFHRFVKHIKENDKIEKGEKMVIYVCNLDKADGEKIRLIGILNSNKPGNDLSNPNIIN